MLEGGKIDSRQAILLLLTLVSPSAILVLPNPITGVAKQDALLSMAFAIIGGLVIALLIAGLGRRFPQKNIFEYPELILGRVLGKIVTLLYVLWFIHLEIIVYGEFGFFINATILPNTPPIAFHLPVTLLSVYLVRQGLEVLARVNQLFTAIALLPVTLVITLGVTNMDLTRLLPFFDRGLSATLHGAVLPVSFLGEIILLAVFIPFLKQPRQASRIAVWGILANGFLVALGIVYSIASIGVEQTTFHFYPFYTAIRIISVGDFLERLESIVAIVWIMGGQLKVSLIRYASTLGSAQCLGLKDYRPLALPIGVLVLAGWSLISGSSVDLMEFGANTWPFYASIFEIGIPALLLIVELIRGLAGEK